MHDVDVTFFIDPGCPFGYSAWPALSALHWRFGDQLRWRTAMIGLAEDPAEYEAKGFDPLFLASSQLQFREHGMPFSISVKDRLWATSLACRTLIAVRLAWPERETGALRALQFAQFCTPMLLDEPADLRRALAAVPGIDAAVAVASAEDARVWDVYEAERAEARSAGGSPAQAQGKTAGERYTAPSLVFSAGDRRLEAGGFQPLAAYDVLLANLAPGLERRPAPEDPAEALEAFPDGLTTAELALVMDSGGETERRLLERMAAGELEREPLGDGALWRLARPTGRFRSLPGGRSTEILGMPR